MDQNKPFDSSSQNTSGQSGVEQEFSQLEQRLHAALETYSNVHRGTGHFSVVTTHLFERARGIVLEYLGLGSDRYVVIFCTPLRLGALKVLLDPAKYRILSDNDAGLPLGVRAIAVERTALPKGVPFQSGGGTTKMVAPDWIIWAEAPDRFEAGTPAIINIIAFAIALQFKKQKRAGPLFSPAGKKLSAREILYNDELDSCRGSEMLEKLKMSHIGRNILVPTGEGESKYVNLDNGASTPTFTQVWNAVVATWQQSEDIRREIIKEAGTICSQVLGAPSEKYDVIFTSNTTESVNILSGQYSGISDEGTEPVVLNTLLEHSSNDLPWRKKESNSPVRIGIDSDGFINMNELEAVLTEYNRNGSHGRRRIGLVAVSGASNVLGIFNDLAAIAAMTHKYDALLLVDGAQLVAHRKVDIERSGIDFLVFSAHKVYAPFGTGVLVARKGTLRFSQQKLELIRSSGEENPGGIAALGKSLLLLQRIGFDLIQKEEQNLTARALKGMAGINGLRIYGIKDPESAAFAHKGGVIIFALKGKMPDVIARELAAKGGIGIRYGCHCAHILVKHLLNVPHALEWIQWVIAKLYPKITFPGVARVSLGLENDETDIDLLIDILSNIRKQPGTNKKPSPDISRYSVKNITGRIEDFARERGRKVYC